LSVPALTIGRALTVIVALPVKVFEHVGIV